LWPAAQAVGRLIRAERRTRVAGVTDADRVLDGGVLARRLREPGTRRLLEVSLGLSGWAFAASVWVYGTMLGYFHLSGDVYQIFLPAGSAFWTGGSPYDLTLTPDGRPFLYSPPWAALFGLLAPAGPTVVHALLVLASLLCLRYIATSWLWAGALCWFVLVPWEIASGQLNLLCAAAIVAAIRGRPILAAFMGFAKISPVLAIHPRDWRPVVVVALLMGLLVTTRLDLWADWVDRLLWATGRDLGPLVPVPFLIRLPVGLALVAYGRPWSRALGAVVATPGLYWSALVLFIAPVAVILNPPPDEIGRPWSIRRSRTALAATDASPVIANP
jgi:hypothetical protein